MKVRTRWSTTAASMMLVFIGITAAKADFITQWQAGQPGRGWPLDGVGGGPEVDFIQERDGQTPAPGNPANTGGEGGDRDVDDDYYFAGTYPDPIGVVADDETAFERAFAGTDNDLRIHFNLPDTLDPADTFRFSFEANNLDQRAVEAPDSRYGIQVFFNDVNIFQETVIEPADLSTIFTSREFTAAEVNAVGGPGADNIVHVNGINFNADGGGNWMGLDYHHLEVNVIPEPSSMLLLISGGFLLLPWAKRK